MKEMKKPVKIAVLAMRKNENGKLGLLWVRGGKIIIYENKIELKLPFNFSLAEFSIDDVVCYRDRKEELLVARIVRMYDGKQDCSIQLFSDAYEKLMTAINERKGKEQL